MMMAIVSGARIVLQRSRSREIKKGIGPMRGGGKTGDPGAQPVKFTRTQQRGVFSRKAFRADSRSQRPVSAPIPIGRCNDPQPASSSAERSFLTPKRQRRIKCLLRGIYFPRKILFPWSRILSYLNWAAFFLIWRQSNFRASFRPSFSDRPVKERVKKAPPDSPVKRMTVTAPE